MERVDRSEINARPSCSICLLALAVMVVTSALVPAAGATTNEQKMRTNDSQSDDNSEKYVLGNGNLLVEQGSGPQGTPGIGGVFFADASPSDNFLVIGDVHGQIGFSYEWDERGVWIWVGAGAVSGTVTWTPAGDQ